MTFKILKNLTSPLNATVEETEARQHLLTRQAAMVFKHSPTGIAAAFLVGLTQTALLWNYVGQAALLLWIGSIILSSMIRLAVWWAGQAGGGLDHNPQRWLQRMVLANMLGGLSWGSSILLYDPGWPVAQQVFAILALAGISAGALSAYAAVYSAFLSMMLPATLPAVFFFLGQADAAYQALGGILLVYVIGISVIGYTHHAALRRSLVLVGDNRDLVDELTDANAQLEQVVQHKQNAMAALRDEKERVQVTLHAIADGVLTTNKSGEVVFLNTVAEQLTGWTRDEAHGMPASEVFRIEGCGEEQQSMPAELQACTEPELQEVFASQRLLRRDGTRFFVDSKTAPIFASDGSSLGTVTVFHDVSRQHQLAERLGYQATHDALTGLINRSEFERLANSLLKRSRVDGSTHIVCYLDLDQFKVVNDSCGHMAGDELLRRLGRALPALLRNSDTVARLGGDEFGILLAKCSLDEAQGFAERVREFVRDYRFVWEDKLFNIGASIGLAEINVGSESVASVLSAADIACYTSKDLGRNQVHVYRDTDQQTGQRQREIELVSQITRALETDRLELYFQRITPSEDVSSPHLHGEILVRMLGPDDEVVSPAQFLPAAERYDLMPSIDLWVVAHTLDWYRKYSRYHSGEVQATLSINLSGASIGQKKFQSAIRQLIVDHEIEPGVICFEITETAAISNLESAVSFMENLRSSGVKFALDDFGSGLSSFAYLKNLPVDYLKIDGSFVRDIVDDPIDREMVNAIHQLGRAMGISTVAEFVENDDILKELVKIGVDYVQGYGISRPEPLTAVRPAGQLELVRATAVPDC